MQFALQMCVNIVGDILKTLFSLDSVFLYVDEKGGNEHLADCKAKFVEKMHL